MTGAHHGLYLFGTRRKDHQGRPRAQSREPVRFERQQFARFAQHAANADRADNFVDQALVHELVTRCPSTRRSSPSLVARHCRSSLVTRRSIARPPPPILHRAFE
jgi:hypothetical protein